MTLADYLESTVSGSVAVVKTDGNGVLQAVRKRVNHTDTETDVVKKEGEGSGGEAKYCLRMLIRSLSTH